MKFFLRTSIGILMFFGALASAQVPSKSLEDPGLAKSNAETAVGGGGIVITSPTMTRPTGTTFNATFRVSDVNGLGIISYQGRVTFNPAVLTYNGCVTTGTISVGGFLCNQPGGPGTIDFVYTHTAPLINDGDGPPSDLFRINFTAFAANGTSTPITITDLQVMEFAVPGTVIPGTITIGATTAADTTISGRVTTQSGRPISGARVALLNDAGSVSFALTNPFGYFRFEGVPTGETYVVNVLSKRYTFQSRVINVGEEVTSLDFVAEQ